MEHRTRTISLHGLAPDARSALACALGLAAAMLGIAPAAALADRHIDRARVVDSRPVFQRVIEPHQECTRHRVQGPAHGGYRRLDAADLVGPVIGGVAGGAIGSQVGGGSGRTAATVAGAVAGTIAGSVLLPPQGRGQPPVATERVVESCRTVERVRDIVQGYDVTWRHQGRLYTTRMAHDPGPFIDVEVRGRGRGPRHAYRSMQPEPAVVVIDRGGRYR